MLRAKLVERGLNGDTAALIFACKAIAGLHEHGAISNEPEEPRSRGIIILASGFDEKGNPIEIPGSRVDVPIVVMRLSDAVSDGAKIRLTFATELLL